MMHDDVAFIIPSRLGSTRLPKKALARIGGKSMIEHVVSGLKSIAGNNLYVATDSAEIASCVEKAGGIAIMTDEACPSGSDRTFEAFKKLPNHDKIQYIVNIQGDMPFVRAKVISDVVTMLKTDKYEIVTPAVKVGKDIAGSDSNVKIVVDSNNRAMYFSRSIIPHGADEFLYHVGIYGYKKEALEKFINMEPSLYEQIEKLEQLRALEAGMSIGVCLSQEIPISVDTEEDLAKAKDYYNTYKLGKLDS